MAKKQGGQLHNRQVCFSFGENLGAEVGQQAGSRKETFNKPWSLQGCAHPLGLRTGRP